VAPFACGPMDAFTDPQVERITLMASARSVKTEILLNMLGYVICQDPGPVLWVGPTEKSVKRACRRIQKMIKESSELARHLTGNQDDLQKKGIILDNLEIIFATAGSAADLGEFEARYIFEDETDKYPADVEGQGSPTQMAEMRGRTFWNRKIVTACTPTIPEGFINTDYQRSDRRRYWVPCPGCGGYQVLDFWQVKHRGAKRLEWPKDKRHPDYIKLERPAVYECLHCQAEIEQGKLPGMLARGNWLPEGWDPQMQTPPPLTSHVGYQWNALNSPFATLAEIAAKYWEVKEDREQYKTFVNLWLGLPWKELVKPREASALLELCTRRPALEVPDNTLALTAGIDNQRRGFWCSIWAWELTGSGAVNQHLIRYGWLSDFTELEIWLFQDVYRTRDGSLAYPVWRGALDTGGGEGEAGDASLTEQAYEWLRLKGQGRVFGIKGASRALAGGRKMVMNLIDRMPGQGRPIPGGIRLWSLDTNALKDAFWSRVESGRVFFHADTGEDFVRQLTAEAKERDKRGRWLWAQQGRQANHYLDTIIYALAMADPECWGGVMVLPKPKSASPRVVVGERGINPFTDKPIGSYWK
jgi:phage terminase large subunit GpA-like protein